MEETLLVPSPNWFQVSILAASKDGWLVYGGPSKSLCVLEPLPPNCEGMIAGDQRFKAHVVPRAHKEKIVSVDISPEWGEKRNLITGSVDGTVKEWNVSQVDNKWTIKNTQSHEAHCIEKEEVVGVGYSTETFVLTVGNFGNIVKWELNANVTKTYNSFLKSFRPMCMSCSPHVALQMAVGTKQGVIFVLDMTENGKILYKVRGQDDEIVQLSWCPQFEVMLKKSLNEKKSLATLRMERIRNEPESTELETSGTGKNLPEDSFEESIVIPEDDMFDIYKDHAADEFGHKKFQPHDVVVKVKVKSEKDDFLAECESLKTQILKIKNEDEESIETLVEAMDKARVDETSDGTESCKESEPATENVEKSEPNPKADKESESIARSDGESESAVKTCIESEDATSNEAKASVKEANIEASGHVHKHLLASVGKYGGVRLWSKTGKVVATCTVLVGSNKAAKSKAPNWPTICWYKPDSLLIADGKSQLLECNPLKIDCKNKLEWRLVHNLHRRALYCIMSSAPRVQTPELLSEPSCDDDWTVWTTAQDRYIIGYSVKTSKKVAVHASCGGFLYDIRTCPYDAGKVAVSVGDGAVRIWETQTANEDETQLLPGAVTCYWQNVQGKVLTCAWHPTKENLLAFSTAESRVGLIDTSGKAEKPARVLMPALSCGVYSMCWGEGMILFACGGGELVMYQANKPDEAPVPINIEIEGQKWELSAVIWSQHGLVVGSSGGGVAVLSGPGGEPLAAKFVFTKMIHMIDWHPQQTSDADGESVHKDLLAVCSLDKQNIIVILRYEAKDGGGKQLSNFKTLSGHKNAVLQVQWSPHRDGQLLSTSQDATVRVWDALAGACTAIFDGHCSTALGAAWAAAPALAGRVLSGGGDCCLRVWRADHYPPEHYSEVKKEPRKRKRGGHKKTNKETQEKADGDKEDIHSDDNAENIAQNSDFRVKISKKFLLPITGRQLAKNNIEGARILLKKHLQKEEDGKSLKELVEEEKDMYDSDYLKLFGSINEVNEVLDMEMENHLTLKNLESYLMLMIFRGHIAEMITFANERDVLDPFLISMAPCVSFKYWKDVTQLYLAQIDRLAANGEEDKLTESKFYGGVCYRKAAVLLSVHDVRGAVEVLRSGKLFKEAYILCRVRHMDSIAEETLNKWASSAAYDGSLLQAAIVNIALGNITQASTTLRRSTDSDYLTFAAELAKAAGLNTFADYIETRASEIEKPAADKTEQILKELPSRIELLMKESKVESGEDKSEQLNGLEGINGKSHEEDVAQNE